MLGLPSEAWGKFKSATKLEHMPEWHPLVDHCADVAACFEALVTRSVISERMARLAGRRFLDEPTIERLAAIAFLHDVGKANSWFQGKILPGRQRPTAGHIDELRPLFHDGDLIARLANCLPIDTMSAWGEAANPLLIAAISHHGRPWNSDKPGDARGAWLADDCYDPFATLREIGARLRKWFPLAFDSDAAALPASPTFQHAFAGLVALADWLGSDTDFFSYSEEKVDRMPFARRQAAAMLCAIGLDLGATRETLRMATPRFGDIFLSPAGDPLVPSEMQERTAGADGGPLVILEAETGSGKTEAALWRFKRLFEAGMVDGLFFALPTRAAATQIHRRITSAVTRMFPSKAAPPVVLAVPGYARVDTVDGRLLPGFDVLWDDEPGARERHRRWASENPKRFLAAPIAVGTVDQVMLSALCVKHAHLRAAALLRHLVVIDEVHASDTYMHAVLREALKAHVAAGGHALLMSATLGTAVRSFYLDLTSRQSTPPGFDEATGTPYPSLAWGISGSARTAISADGVEKSVRRVFGPFIDDAEAIARAALEGAQLGAAVLVVRNTVKGAVAVQQALEAMVNARDRSFLFRCAGVVTLHHGRFAREDRRDLDAAVEARMGRGRSAGGLVLVGTQTLEQSLDIDADLLVTDLCPMDVLLQRIGRLHRHRRSDRPVPYEAPQVIVLAPAARDLASLLKRGLHGLGSVYPDLRMIEATWRQLEAHEQLRIPAMNRLLVEHATHPAVLDELVRELGPSWLEHGATVAGRGFAQLGVAAAHCLPREKPFGSFTFPDLDEAVRTRLGEADRLVEWSKEEGPLPIGPFGQDVRALTLPSHLCRGIEAEAAPTIEAQRGDGFAFRLGDVRFDYGRHGIHRSKNN